MDQLTRFQARVFDPLLQRFRDDQAELRHRTMEEGYLKEHLNRARDQQFVHERKAINILTNEPKIHTVTAEGRVEPYKGQLFFDVRTSTLALCY